MKVLENLFSTSLVGETVGQVMRERGCMPSFALSSFTFSPPFCVSSDITSASMLGSSIVTPKGLLSSKRMTSS